MRSGSERVAYVSRFNLTASFGSTQERPAAEPAGIALLSKDGRFVANTLAGSRRVYGSMVEDMLKFASDR